MKPSAQLQFTQSLTGEGIIAVGFLALSKTIARFMPTHGGTCLFFQKTH